MDFNDLELEQKYVEFCRVLKTMEQYNRKSGWMRWDGDIMRFYDGEVEDGAFVHIGFVRYLIDNIKKSI
jgi:hypothetical protein